METMDTLFQEGAKLVVIPHEKMCTESHEDMHSHSYEETHNLSHAGMHCQSRKRLKHKKRLQMSHEVEGYKGDTEDLDALIQYIEGDTPSSSSVGNTDPTISLERGKRGTNKQQPKVNKKTKQKNARKK